MAFERKDDVSAAAAARAAADSDTAFRKAVEDAANAGVHEVKYTGKVTPATIEAVKRDAAAAGFNVTVNSRTGLRGPDEHYVEIY